MTTDIYLAFINKHFSRHCSQLNSDLHNCLPFDIHCMNIEVDLQKFYSELRNQFHSTKILSALSAFLPNEKGKIVGMTSVDIYVPILTFLFGEAQLNGKCAVVSTFRLKNEFYGLPENPAILYQRLLKEILHELGHTLNLIHCPLYSCVMNSSTYVEDIDLKRAGYCRDCRQKINATC